ncbi:MAG: GNAT family N-acetyltransferase [Pseudomonadota bacterium]
MAVDLTSWKLPRVARDGLRLEPLKRAHEADLTDAASDPRIWAGHPVKVRYKPDVFKGYFEFLLSGGGTVVVSENDTGRVVGCSRYYPVPDIPDAIGIGFTFLVRDHWGGPSNFTLKSMMLDHAFQTFDTVWFHVDPSNFRSQAATAKIGVSYQYDDQLALGPRISSWKCYTITRAQWAEKKEKVLSI